MTVYVDELRSYPISATACAQAQRTFAGKWSCHLTAGDLTPASVEELHQLAAAMGLKRAWFQAMSWPHYDLTERRRPMAVSVGAVEETCRAGAQRRLVVRAAQNHE